MLFFLADDLWFVSVFYFTCLNLLNDSQCESIYSLIYFVNSNNIYQKTTWIEFKRFHLRRAPMINGYTWAKYRKNNMKSNFNSLHLCLVSVRPCACLLHTIWRVVYPNAAKLRIDARKVLQITKIYFLSETPHLSTSNGTVQLIKHGTKFMIPYNGLAVEGYCCKRPKCW